MKIDPKLTLNQLIQRHPDVLPVLAAAGIDTCCGGALSLEEAARRAGVDLVDLERASAPVNGAPPVCSCGCVEP
jgi:regulator of cell morphogenesis and NO signaling